MFKQFRTQFENWPPYGIQAHGTTKNGSEAFPIHFVLNLEKVASYHADYNTILKKKWSYEARL